MERAINLAAEAQFRELAEAMPQLVWMAKPDGWIFWYNRRWYEYTGTTPEQMEGWGWKAVHDPATLPQVLERWQHSITTGEPFEMVFPLKGADGQFRPFLTRIHPVRDREGRVIRWFGTNTDISGQQRIENQLRESEARFQQIADTIEDIFWIVDLKQPRVEYVSAAYEKLTGHSREKVYESFDGWVSSIHPQDRERVLRNFYALPQVGKFDEEFRFVRADGSLGWARGRGYPVREADGTSTRVIGVTQDITDRKLAQDLVQRHSRQMEEQAQLLDLANDAIIARDSDGNIVFWNRGSESLYGWSPEEALGKNVHQLLGTSPQMVREFRAALQAQGEWLGELRHVSRHGRRIVVTSRHVVQRNAEGGVERILEINRDITDRKQAEEKIRQQASLLDLSREAILVWEFRGGIQYWNQGAERLYGFSAMEAVGRSSHQLLRTVHPLPLEEFLQLLERDHRWMGEIVHHDRSGREVVVESRQELIRGSRGQLLVLETNRDMTQRKRDEQALRLSEQRLALAQEAGGVGIWDWDIPHDLASCSPQYFRLFGLPENTPPQTTAAWLSHVHPEDREKAARLHEEAKSGAQDLELEYRVIWPDGSVHWLACKGNSVRNHEGKVERVTGVIYDVTERKRAEQELLDTQQHLENMVAHRTAALQELSGRLLRMQDEERRRIARELHDSMGQELSVMKMLLETAAQRGLADAENKQGIGQALEIAENVLKEVRSLSYLLHPPLLDEMGLVPALRWYVDGLIQRSGLQVSLSIKPEELPRLAPELETAVFRIVQESLTNVYKHAQSQTASVEVEQSESELRVRIQDSGRGIALEKLESLSTTIGVGIGGMRERVRQFGGDVRIVPADPGTMVDVVIPLRREPAQNASEPLRSTA